METIHCNIGGGDSQERGHGWIFFIELPSWKNKDFWLYSGKTRILSSNNNKTRPIDLKDPEEILTLRLSRYP